MRHITTPAIILRRTNYGEADRIVSFLTPQGKLRALVKGVRRSKSKLAGGIELFSESSVTFIETKGDLARIVSTRLNIHWDTIVGNLGRMMFGYEAMKLMDSLIEDEAEEQYYNLLKNTLEALADVAVTLEAVETWFYVRLLYLQGHGLNLKTDSKGQRLQPDTLYSFSFENMCFDAHPNGEYRAEHIKLLRLCGEKQAQQLAHVKDVPQLATPLAILLKKVVTANK